MTAPAIVDDAELLRMAERPAEPLMPVLDRASAMWPLIVVFALFPITFATYYRTFDDDDALWATRAVDVLAAAARTEALLPGAEPERLAGPMSSWLGALVLSMTWPGWPVMTTAVSAVAIALTGFAVYMALRSLAGARFALWTTLLVCCHPLVLAAGTSPAPRALGGWLQVAALGCLLRHRISQGRVVGIWNVATGVLLGATLLASGPAFVVGVVTATIYVILRSAFGRDERRNIENSPRGTIRSLGALGVVLAIALVVGGWWLVVAVSTAGSTAVAGWLSLATSDTRSTVFGPADVPLRLVALSGVVSALAAFGVWQCLARVRDEAAEPRRVAAMLLSWFASAVGGWMIVAGWLPNAEAIREWEFAAIVPLLALAAVGVEAIRERAIGVLPTCLAAIASLSVWIVWQTGGTSWSRAARERIESGDATLLPTGRAGWLVVVASIGAVALLYGAWRAYSARDGWQRTIASLTIVGLVVLQVAIGFVSARRTTGDDRALKQFQGQLARFSDVREVLIVGDASASPRVTYVLRRLWPGTSVERAPNRDEAIAVILTRVPANRLAVLVDTDAEGSRPFDSGGERFDVTVVSPRRLFREQRLRAHVLVRLAGNETTADASPSARP